MQNLHSKVNTLPSLAELIQGLEDVLLEVGGSKGSLIGRTLQPQPLKARLQEGECWGPLLYSCVPSLRDRPGAYHPRYIKGRMFTKFALPHLKLSLTFYSYS